MYFEIIELFKSLENKDNKKIMQRFFKTGKGEYGEGDIFLGIKVPVLRKISKDYYDKLSLKEVERLLHNKYHEIRLTALFIMILKYKEEPNKIYDMYLRNTKYINNWDLVDLSASYIIGRHIFENNISKNIIYELSDKELWDQRIAILSTHYFIKKNEFEDTINLSKKYLNTKHDLIKKAVGWMLREIGKRDELVLLKFLNENIKDIPGITFSYATERISKEEKNKLNIKRK